MIKVRFQLNFLNPVKVKRNYTSDLSEVCDWFEYNKPITQTVDYKLIETETSVSQLKIFSHFQMLGFLKAQVSNITKDSCTIRIHLEKVPSPYLVKALELGQPGMGITLSDNIFTLLKEESEFLEEKTLSGF